MWNINFFEPHMNALNKFFDSTLVMIWLRESTTKVKRNGERGSSCLRPLEARKNLLGEPLRII